MSSIGTASPDQQTIDLSIGGMTCAACANRIERKLNKLEGVEASVNYATEKARVRFAPGVAPEDLVAEVEKAGYTAQLPAPKEPSENERAGDTELLVLRLRVIVSAALAVPVIAVSMVPAFQFPYWQWVALVLATPVVLWAGWPFHRAAATNLRHGAATMDTLVSVGTLAAYLWSAYALVFGAAGRPGMVHGFSLFSQPSDQAEYIYLEVAAGVTLFLLAGRYFEKRSKRNSAAAITALLEMGAKEATVLQDGREILTRAEDLRVGDVFLVRPGERIATDGVVIEGRSAVDLSMLTGEAVPVEVGTGGSVTGGTMNAGGRLVVRASRVGADTELAHMAALVEDAQNGKAQAQRLADRVSGVFVPVVIVIAVVVLGAWLLAGASPTFAFTTAVAVLIVACPCALGLATPTALLVGTGRGAQLGLLLRGPEALESSRAVDTVLLDKTGTVTAGRMSIAEISTTPGTSRTELLQLAAALEASSEHPIARAIAATVDPADRPAVASFESVEGKGVHGQVGERLVVVGNRSLMQDWGLAYPAALAEAIADASGATVVAVGWDAEVRGVIAVADTVKDSSAEAVRELQSLGLSVILLTGDQEAAARRAAEAVGITEIIAGVLPAEKVETVRRLQRSGKTVAMVGDGVNDAAALAQADLGVAMGTGTDVAIAAADITIVGGDLRGAADAIRLARRTLGTIKGNLFWAFAYNIAAVPLAALGLLNPMLAGAAMAISSVFVVSNSLRLRSFTPRRLSRPAACPIPETSALPA